MNNLSFWLYLAVTAGVTYLVRALPLVLVKGKLKNRFVLSFLHYMPYAVLSSMTFPAVFYSTGNVISATVGVMVALILSFFKRSLLLVAASASAAVLITELILRYLINV